MYILREYLGGGEMINVSTDEGFEYWANDIIQNHGVAQLYIERLKDDGVSFLVNGNEAEFIERYTRFDTIDSFLRGRYEVIE